MFVHYLNGNYIVILNLEDGTKIRYNNEDSFIPHRPESLDVKITDKCEHNCAFCHENSTVDGKRASFESMEKFVSTVPAYTEIAVGGGNLMLNIEHTETFLNMLKKAEAIPSITIRQDDFIKYQNIIKNWKKQHLIYGIGVSLTDAADEELYKTMEKFPTSVLHVIAGVLTEKDYNLLKNHNIKMLILGYKIRCRGLDFWSRGEQRIKKNQQNLEKHIPDFKKDFNTVSFDNLALEQLHMRQYVSPQTWETSFFGDDGHYTFYVDLVNGTYSKSSSTAGYNILIGKSSVIEMFNNIRRRYA